LFIQSIKPAAQKNIGSSACAPPPLQIIPRTLSSRPNERHFRLVTIRKLAHPQHLHRIAVTIDEAGSGVPVSVEKAQDRHPGELLASAFAVEIHREMLPEIMLPHAGIPMEIGGFGVYDPFRQSLDIAEVKLRLELANEPRKHIVRKR
jgi:hypothetical protein